jgi:transcriptional regulator
MYIPEQFAAVDADALIARLAKHAAGILVTLDEAGAPVATHAPIIWDSERKVARGHIARANPQWRSGGDGKGLIVLSGPEAYVSPSWYPSKAEHGKAVPTWNYEAVHLTGRVEWFDDPARLLDVVRALSDAHELERADPWSVDDVPRSYIDAMLRGIVGVELHAERIEAKRKLSQNKQGADFDGVANGLRDEPSAMAHEVAALMQDAKS